MSLALPLLNLPNDDETWVAQNRSLQGKVINLLQTNFKFTHLKKMEILDLLTWVRFSLVYIRPTFLNW